MKEVDHDLSTYLLKQKVLVKRDSGSSYPQPEPHGVPVSAARVQLAYGYVRYVPYLPLSDDGTPYTLPSHARLLGKQQVLPGV